MNIADVTIADPSIGLSVRHRATAAPIADGQRHTVGSALEASDKLPALVAGSFRSGDFSSTEPIRCKPTEPPHSTPLDHWPRCKVCHRWELLPRNNLPRHMFCIAVRKRAAAGRQLSLPKRREALSLTSREGACCRERPSGLATHETNPMPLRSNTEAERPGCSDYEAASQSLSTQHWNDGGSFAERLPVST
jgi:hypothetical protein